MVGEKQVCPECLYEMKFIKEYGHSSEFYKCTNKNCKLLWELVYDSNTNNLEFIDVKSFLDNIKKERKAM